MHNSILKKLIRLPQTGTAILVFLKVYQYPQKYYGIFIGHPLNWAPFASTLLR